MKKEKGYEEGHNGAEKKKCETAKWTRGDFIRVA
jgi:hypothetical protein